MKRCIVIVLSAMLGMAGTGASAHRLDEYLQATLLSVAPGRIEGSMRLIPGQAVASAVIAAIDTNADGVFSEAEQQAYARRVVADQSITVDGRAITASLVSWRFPVPEALRGGLGEIHIDYSVATPLAAGDRTLVLANRHLSRTSAYLMNAVVPDSPEIRVLKQKRNARQSLYEIDYRQDATSARRSRSQSSG